MNTTQGRIVPGIVIMWLAVAVALSASGKMTAWPPPVPQLVILSLASLTLLAVFLAGNVRAWASSVPICAFIALHLTRLACLRRRCYCW